MGFNSAFKGLNKEGLQGNDMLHALEKWELRTK
jgi:hypothetical protein